MKKNNNFHPKPFYAHFFDLMHLPSMWYQPSLATALLAATSHQMIPPPPLSSHTETSAVHWLDVSGAGLTNVNTERRCFFGLLEDIHSFINFIASWWSILLFGHLWYCTSTQNTKTYMAKGRCVAQIYKVHLVVGSSSDHK